MLLAIVVFELFWYSSITSISNKQTSINIGIYPTIPYPTLVINPRYNIPRGQDFTQAISPANIKLIWTLRKKFITAAELHIEEKGQINKIVTNEGRDIILGSLDRTPNITIFHLSEDDLRNCKIYEKKGNIRKPIKFSDLKLNDIVLIKISFDTLSVEEKITGTEIDKISGN